ncbi:MAG: 4-hydroxy-tetrahydrodipicolinate synthase [Patescibacteria group bacterium]
MLETLKENRHICAVVTPFDKKGNIDYKAHYRHLKWLKKEGVEAIVSLGTTGESPTVSFKEHAEMLKRVVRFSPLPVIAGAGGNSTAEAIRLTKEAEKAGAIAVLSVAPYYNRPSQAGLLEHYTQICQSTGLPVLLYNVPTRTGVNIEVDTVLRIRERCRNFAGIKEASNNLAAVQRYVLNDIPVYCGEDALNFAMLCLGARGVISVLSNFAGHTIASLIAEIQKNHLEMARAINYIIADFAKAAFVETNPIPTKYICSKLGFCENSLRLPLTTLSEENEKTVDKLLERHLIFATK